MTKERVTTIRKISLTILIAGVLASVAGFGAYSAFSATTSNTGNSFTSGSVKIDDSDGGSAALYSSADHKPGESDVSCIRVTYTGSLAASVKLYLSGAITNGTQFNLKVERGTQAPAAFPLCTGFVPSGDIAYDGALGSFPTSYAAGSDGKDAGAAWATNDVVAYRFTITLNDDTTANAHTTDTPSGVHAFHWEARNN